MATKADARDIIRRDKLSLLTSVEEFTFYGSGTNTPGDPSSTHPTPTNIQINSQIDMALSFINRRCELGEAFDVEVEVEAQTTDGPLAIPLRTVGSGAGLSPGMINTIERVYWEESGTTRRLLPRSRQDFDTGYWTQWQEQSPSTVGDDYGGWFWIEGYTLYLLPAPSSAGTLHLLAGTGIAFAGEAASLECLPNDFHDIVWNCAAWFVARNQPINVEMQTLAAQYQMAVVGRDGKSGGIGEILEWKRGISAQEPETAGIQPARAYARRRGR